MFIHIFLIVNIFFYTLIQIAYNCNRYRINNSRSLYFKIHLTCLIFKLNKITFYSLLINIFIILIFFFINLDLTILHEIFFMLYNSSVTHCSNGEEITIQNYPIRNLDLTITIGTSSRNSDVEGLLEIIDGIYNQETSLLVNSGSIYTSGIIYGLHKLPCIKIQTEMLEITNKIIFSIKCADSFNGLKVNHYHEFSQEIRDNLNTLSNLTYNSRENILNSYNKEFTLIKIFTVDSINKSQNTVNIDFAFRNIFSYVQDYNVYMFDKNSRHFYTFLKMLNYNMLKIDNGLNNLDFNVVESNQSTIILFKKNVISLNSNQIRSNVQNPYIYSNSNNTLTLLRENNFILN